MIKTLLKTAVLAAALSTAAQAATLSHGHLSRVEGSSVIHDSLNQLEWLGWDATRGLSYAQTLAATQQGGAFEGFRVAGHADADRFADALMGAQDWMSSYGFGVNVENNAIEQMLGESYYDYRQAWGYTYDYDYVFFMSDNGTGADVGLLEMSTFNNGPDRLASYGEWADVTNADYYSAPNTGYSIGWLLVRDANQVPEPAGLALSGLALLAAFGLRRRRG